MKLVVGLMPLLALIGSTAGSTAQQPPSIETVVGRYLEARGGADRWRKLQALELKGSYAAFSQQSPFVLIRRRGDLYRLDYDLLGSPAVRARDGDGPWMLNGLLQPEAVRVTEDPYKGQLERESIFEPLLLDYSSKGITVDLVGAGDVDGVETIDLTIRLPDGTKELWHLDAATYLEVAVDSEVVDLTQFAEPVQQRAFFNDFRSVDGLMLPYLIELEFGARLESMIVEEIGVDPELDTTRFQLVSDGD